MRLLSDQLESARVLVDPQSRGCVCFSEGTSLDLLNARVGAEVSRRFGARVVDSQKTAENFARNVQALRLRLAKLGAQVEAPRGEVSLLDRGFWFTLKDVLYWLSPRAKYVFHQNLGLGRRSNSRALFRKRAAPVSLARGSSPAAPAPVRL